MTVVEIVAPHPSGLGVFLVPPTEIFYRFWRNPPVMDNIYDEDTGVFIEAKEVPVMSGYTRKQIKYLDWGAEPKTGRDGKILPITYRLEVADSLNGPWREVWVQPVLLEPLTTYSPLEDDEMYLAANIRDAVIVFFSYRLAELVRSGRVFCKNKKHALKFPVTPYFEFENAELPALAIDLKHGSVSPFSLGYDAGEERLTFACAGGALDRKERDSLSDATRYLARDLDWFLDDLGCTNTVIDSIAHGNHPAEPPLYTWGFSVHTTTYGLGDVRDMLWEMVPITRWRDEPLDNTGHIF